MRRKPTLTEVEFTILLVAWLVPTAYYAWHFVMGQF